MKVVAACLDCGKGIGRRAERCKECSSKARRKESPKCSDCGESTQRRSERCWACHVKARRQTSKNYLDGNRYKNNNGYILKLSPEHPSVKNKRDKYIAEHRLVMEKHLGRYLKKEEVVHHINGKKDDNRLENLKLFKNTATHHKYHWVEMRTRTYCCPNCKEDFKLEEITHGRVK